MYLRKRHGWNQKWGPRKGGSFWTSSCLAYISPCSLSGLARNDPHYCSWIIEKGIVAIPILLLPVVPFSCFSPNCWKASRKSLTLASGPLASVLESSWPILSLLWDGLSKPPLHLEIAASVALGNRRSKKSPRKS